MSGASRNPVADLCAAALHEVTFEDVTWRLARLTTARAAECRVLLQLLGTVIGVSTSDAALERAIEMAQAAQDRDELVAAMDAFAAARRLQEADRAPVSTSEVDRIEAAILCDCVRAVRRGEGEWIKVQLVPRLELQDEAKGRVWVETIPTSARGMLIAMALKHLREAQGVLRPFRPGQQDAPGPGPSGDEVRADAP